MASRDEVLTAMYAVVALSAGGVGVSEIVYSLSSYPGCVGSTFSKVLREYSEGSKLSVALRKTSASTRDKGLKKLLLLLAEHEEGRLSSLESAVKRLIRDYVSDWSWRKWLNRARTLSLSVAVILSVALLVSTLLVVLGRALESLPLIRLGIPGYISWSRFLLLASLALAAILDAALWGTRRWA